MNLEAQSHAQQPVHALTAEECLTLLGVAAGSGLTSSEARARLAQYGPNELAEKRRPGLVHKLIVQLSDFLIVILILASIFSLLVGEVTDALVIMAIVVVNALLGVYQESKADRALEALQKMAAPTVDVVRDSQSVSVPARDVVPGDIVLLEAGDVVPADLRLVEAWNLRVDESALTGESVPAEKQAPSSLASDVPVTDRTNCVFAGTTITYGRGKGVTYATGRATQVGMIADMIQSVDEGSTPLQQKLGALGRSLGTAALAVCGVVTVVGLIRGGRLLDMVLVGVSLAVAAIPEGLPAVVTIVLALGMNRMVKRNVIVRKLLAAETLGCVTAICSDKTGTLTQNRMAVTRAYAGGEWFTVQEGGSAGAAGDRGRDQAGCPGPALEMALQVGVLCNDATLITTPGAGEAGGRTDFEACGDPTEVALLTAGARFGLYRAGLESMMPRVGEIPFDSERKRMTTLHAEPGEVEGGVLVCTKGAPDIIIGLCDRLMRADGSTAELGEAGRHEVLEAGRSMAQDALRVLAVAYRHQPCPAPGADPVAEAGAGRVTSVQPSPEQIEVGLVFVGLVGMMDPPRPEAVDAVQECFNAGIRPFMITGDFAETARAVAKRLGILSGKPYEKVVSGGEIEKMTDEELQMAVETARVFARVSPGHKVRIVNALRARNHITAMTGDGVNDAPSLKAADIGVAMGITGSDVAKNTADMVLTDDNFASIVAAVEEGRIIYGNIRKFVSYLLSCNIGEILIILVAMLIGWPIPLVPIQLLWLNLVTDSFPALALGAEKGEPHIMRDPPRAPDEPILNRLMRRSIAIQSTLLAGITLFAFAWALRRAGFAGPSDQGLSVTYARTVAFATLVTAELVRAHSSRSERYLLARLGPVSNPFLVWATLLSGSLLAAAIYVPALQPVFKTVALGVGDWEVILGLALLPLLGAELGKLLFVGRTRHRGPQG